MESRIPKPLTKKERNELRRQRKRHIADMADRRRHFKKIVHWGLVFAAIVAFGWLISLQPNLPPTSIQGHIEKSPSSHIINQPIPDATQRHMLEHADGNGKPGILVQYNCVKYPCEPGLANRLAELVRIYPDNVYIAPGDYDGMIVLTRLGKLKILDSPDLDAIEKFINE